MTDHYNVIVARYDEDVSWAHKFDEFVIIQKGAQLPNKGREPTSYLWYIINHYDDLKGDYIFLQGNPNDHCNLYYEMRKGFNKPFYWFETYGRTGLVCDMDGKPHDNVQVGEFLELIGIEYDKELITFNGCCLFSTTAKRIRRRTKSFYQNVYNVIMDSPSRRFEYAFERTLGLIFNE